MAIARSLSVGLVLISIVGSPQFATVNKALAKTPGNGRHSRHVGPIAPNVIAGPVHELQIVQLVSAAGAPRDDVIERRSEALVDARMEPVYWQWKPAATQRTPAALF